MQTEKIDDYSDLDRRLVFMSQSGLPLHNQPYQQLANQLGVSSDVVMSRFESMLSDGRIRRIGVVPNHYRLGYTANAMTVWDIKDQYIKQVGEQVSVLERVSHCYQRPRALPHWPYNLFAMVHGIHREEVMLIVKEIETLIGQKCDACDVLFSTRILKKTGLRFAKG